MRRDLHHYRYLVLGMIVAAIVSLTAIRYLTATGRIDLSSGGLADWPQYGHDQEGTRYTPLNQINRDNVTYLEIAWEYHTGDFSEGSDGRPETTAGAPRQKLGPLDHRHFVGRVWLAVTADPAA